MAKQAGRNPDELSIIIRANVEFTEKPLGGQRWIFSGSADEVRSDIQAVRELGAAEVHFDPTFSAAGTSVEGYLETMERVRELAG
jgi:alkanesulfonate monooxygenase SsuD/methylene tetrahydromethanopterin reductase-like flavin-dependent oxidoreductase (luciferase family)